MSLVSWPNLTQKPAFPRTLQNYPKRHENLQLLPKDHSTEEEVVLEEEEADTQVFIDNKK